MLKLCDAIEVVMIGLTVLIMSNVSYNEQWKMLDCVML
jgi:hypothetical protein